MQMADRDANGMKSFFLKTTFYLYRISFKTDFVCLVLLLQHPGAPPKNLGGGLGNGGWGKGKICPSFFFSVGHWFTSNSAKLILASCSNNSL